MSRPTADRTTRIKSERPGVFVDLDAAARDGAIQALRHSDAPLTMADDLVALVTGPALKATVLKRVEQVVTHGHTPGEDLMLPVGCIVTEVIISAQRVRTAIGKRDLAAARERLALCSTRRRC
jgi:hypothetical protein